MLKTLEISDHTWYRFRAEYKGMDVNQLKRLKELKEENAKLKAAVADLTLANMVLVEVA
jgi:putative transposase